MTRDHRNISTADLAFEDYDAYINSVVESVLTFEDDYLAPKNYDWEFVWDAKRLYENGRFGNLVSVLENQPSREQWEHMKTADCLRCGAENVGIIGVTHTVETPNGELFTLDQHSELCRECFDRVADDLEDHGEPQPTLTRGRWWASGGGQRA